jgi:hypothetical protein
MTGKSVQRSWICDFYPYLAKAGLTESGDGQVAVPLLFRHMRIKVDATSTIPAYHGFISNQS